MKLSSEAWRLVLDTALDAVVVMDRDGKLSEPKHPGSFFVVRQTTVVRLSVRGDSTGLAAKKVTPSVASSYSFP